MVEMRLEEREWKGLPPAQGDRLELEGATARLLPPKGALLVSGSLKPAINRFARGSRTIGVFGEEKDGSLAIRIARDRALLITPQPLEVQAGWNRAGYMVTPADDLFIAVSLTGEKADALMSLLVALPLTATSPSASLMLAGLPALVTRIEGGYCIRVERSHVTALWQHLSALAGREFG